MLLPLLLILLFAPLWAVTLGVAAISTLATYEVLSHWPTPIKKRIRLAACCLTPFVYTLIYLDVQPYYYMALFFVFLLLMFFEVLADYDNFGFFGLVGVCFCGAVFPALYSSMVRIAALPDHAFLAIIPFLITISSDAFALFAGKLFGKHRLAPVVSPRKTIEGSVGGFVCCVGVMLGYGAVVSLLGAQVDYLRLFVYAAVGGVLAQTGDLSMSAVKRSLGIKDFGKVFPGHGGILDRFDSLLFVAPIVEILIYSLPAVTLL
jgi:phosphatidate cytidylyltransferase